MGEKRRVRALQAAEKLGFSGKIDEKQSSGAEQAAEKLDLARFCNKGTTSVGPQMPDNKGWALAPAGCFSGNSPKFWPFSAACEALVDSIGSAREL
jgi:hypothetical protein